jgi:hypothetical protein
MVTRGADFPLRVTPSNGMHQLLIQDDSGNVLATVWSDRPIGLSVADRIEIDGVASSVRRISDGVIETTKPLPLRFMTDFLRYHVLFRVFDGDITRWRGAIDASRHEDLFFLDWLAERTAEEPELLAELREIVDASGLWPTDGELSSSPVF